MPANTKAYNRKNYKKYWGTTAAKKDRNGRNVARRRMEKAGKVNKGDDKNVHHKNNNPRDNKKSNLQITTERRNKRLGVRKANSHRKT